MKIYELLNNPDFDVNAEIEIECCYYPSEDEMKVVPVYSSLADDDVPEDLMEQDIYYMSIGRNKNGSPCLVVQYEGISKVKENQLEWLDCFEIESDWQAYWLYYNPDGNDGDGQIVEVSIHPHEVPVDETNEDYFWSYLNSECKTWLHDNDGLDDDFNSYAIEMLNWPSDSDTHRNNVTKDTMQWLIKWAKNNK